MSFRNSHLFLAPWWLSYIPLILLSTAAMADAPVVEDADMPARTRIDVSLSHADTGWDHYADGWEIRLKDGTVLGHRILHHPHVTEQPFTRSLGGLDIPDGTQTVYVFAKDNLGHWSKDGYPVSVPN